MRCIVLSVLLCLFCCGVLFAQPSPTPPPEKDKTTEPRHEPTQQEKDAAMAAGGALFGMSVLGFLCFLAFVLLMSFIPPIIALLRHHPNTGAIFALTLLLGWTGIGWIAALIWAFTNPPHPGSVVVVERDRGRPRGRRRKNEGGDFDFS
jgi:hypothetical protein